MTRAWLALALSISGCSLLIDTDPFQTPRDGGVVQQDGDLDGGTEPDGDTPPPDAPSAPVVRITPEDPVTTDDLTMEIVTESVDPLGAGAVAYRIEWLRDGVDAGIAAATASAAETAKGETWTVRVVPTSADGERTGAAGTAAVTIGNLPPTLSYVGLGDYRPIEGETLEALTGPVTDPDGDGTRYVYTWLLDGDPIADEAGPRLVLDSFAPGSRIKVRVTPRDAGDLDGEALETGEAIVVEDTIRWRQLAPDRFYGNHGRIVYDPPNNRVLVFYHSANAVAGNMHVWEYALEPLGARWIELHPSGDPIQLIGTLPPILDAVNRRLLFIGGYEGETLTSRVVAFDLSVRGAERWQELTPSGDPPTLGQFASVAYDEERQQVLLHPGVAAGTFDAVDELSVLDASRAGFESWTHVALPGGGVAGAAIVVDPERDRALFLGGLGVGAGGTPTLVDTIYTLDLGALTDGLSLATARLPSALALSTAALDRPRDRVVLAWGLETFGGPAASMRALDLATLTVTDLSPTEAPAPGVSGFMHPDPYDSARFIVHPGPPAADGSDSRPRVDLYAMNPETAAFTPLTRYGIDAPPALSGALSSPSDSGFTVFGGEDSLRGFHDEVWKFHRWMGWSRIATTADTVTGRTPEPREGAGGATTFEGLALFGGRGSSGLTPASAWTLRRLTDSTAEWVEHTLASGSPAPDPRAGPSVLVPHSCLDGEMALFGGSEGGGEMWTLECPAGDLRGCTWRQIALGGAPPARSHGTIENTVLFGGRTDVGVLDDVWVFDGCADPPSWMEVTPTGAGPTRWGHTMTRRGDDSLAGVTRHVIFGGSSTMNLDAGLSNQAWMLVRESDAFRWELLTVASGPNDAVIDARSGHVAAWSEDRGVHRLFVYGGTNENNARSDLWELRFPPSSP